MKGHKSTPRYTNLKEEKNLMKNKKNLLKFTNIVLFITMIAIILVSGTYAKYTSTASGTSATVVANWSFNVNDKNIAKETFEFNLFDTANIKDSDGSEEDDVAEGLIAPGTSGAFEFALQNTSDVTAEYEIELSVDNTDIPLEFSFTGEDDSWTTNLADLVAKDTMGIGSTKNVTMQWRWPFGDNTVTDTTLGGKTVKVTAQITATQVDNSDITYVEKPIFANMLTDFPESYIDSSAEVKPSYASFAYENVDLFSGKTITKIGIPIKSVSAIDDNQTFTIYVVDKTKVANFQKAEPIKTYVVSPNQEDLGSNASAVNKWVYIDLKTNIVLSENETLAFASETDTVKFGYNSKSNSWSKKTEYNFRARITSSPSTATSENLLFDVYYKEAVNTKASTLSSALSGKNFSILGDSISTFAGYSNDSTNTNSTIGSNAVFYNGSNASITNVNQTWWMQTVNETGMNLLVNNSYSGDRIISGTGLSRAIELHDDTGDNAGTNPDIIAVYLGINDFDNGTSLGTYSNDMYNNLITDNGNETFTYANASTFAEGYAIMIHKILNKYEDADVFVFTFVPNSKNTNYTLLEQFNDVIRNIANYYGDRVNVVDLYNDSGITTSNYTDYCDDSEELHPNPEGMDLITNTFIDALESKYLNN